MSTAVAADEPLMTTVETAVASALAPVPAGGAVAATVPPRGVLFDTTSSLGATNDRHDLDQSRYRRAPPRLRRHLQRAHLRRHGRRRLHGLAPDRGARRAGR